MVTRANEIPDTAVATKDSDDSDNSARIQQILERFAVMQTFWSNIHDEGRQDDRFVAGKQWPEIIAKEREEDHRPMLTYNLLPAFTRQIINKVRQERPQVRVKPVESDKHQTPDVSNVQGTKDYSLADVYMGIIRNIEHQSRADHAYDTALTHAVHHGFGYFYLRNQYSTRNPFIQDLRILRVKNSYSVYLDPGSLAVDYSDAQDGFMFTSMTKNAFEKKYPDERIGEFSHGGSGGLYDGWFDKDGVRLAEYYYLEYVDDHVIMMSNGKVHYESQVEAVLDEMEKKEGVYIAQNGEGKELRKPVKRPECMWLKMTADNIIDGPLELPFEQVPIFPVLGDEINLDGRITYESAIRHAIDPQRSYNYWRTAAAETVALAPKAPFIIDSKQIKGWEHQWEKANSTNMSHLTYNAREGVPPPKRNFPSAVAAAELSNATQDAADMQAIIGLHDASLGKEGNEKSGKAILARQSQGSTSTYTFPDNLNRALEAMGRVLVKAIPRIYDTQRVMRIRLSDDSEDFVQINETKKDDKSGKDVLVHDLSYGEYDVVVETGPSYATQRQEALEAQLELLGKLPDDMGRSIVHLVVKNMALPGSEEIAVILRKMLPDELKSEDERAADLPKGVIFDDQGNPIVEKSGEPYQPPLSPEQQIAQRQQELEQAEIEAKQAKAEAEKETAKAKIEEARVKLAEVQAAAQGGGEQPGPDFNSLIPELERIIQEAMEAHEISETAHKGAIQEAVTEAVMDALKRTRAFVEKRLQAAVPSGKSGQPGGGVTEPGRDDTAASSVVIEMPVRETKLKFERKDGRITSATISHIGPKPADPPGAKIKRDDAAQRVDFEYDDEQIVGATIKPK